MTIEQIERVETLVNEAIERDLTVYSDIAPLEKPGKSTAYARCSASVIPIRCAW